MSDRVVIDVLEEDLFEGSSSAVQAMAGRMRMCDWLRRSREAHLSDSTSHSVFQSLDREYEMIVGR